jgi:DNA-binding NtrC family response regulator
MKAGAFDFIEKPFSDQLLIESVQRSLEWDNRQRLEAASFVHPHWMVVDPSRNALLVTGGHTGHLGVMDTTTRAATQVLPVSVMNSVLSKLVLRTERSTRAECRMTWSRIGTGLSWTR